MTYQATERHGLREMQNSLDVLSRFQTLEREFKYLNHHTRQTQTIIPDMMESETQTQPEVMPLESQSIQLSEESPLHDLRSALGTIWGDDLLPENSSRQSLPEEHCEEKDNHDEPMSHDDERGISADTNQQKGNIGKVTDMQVVETEDGEKDNKDEPGIYDDTNQQKGNIGESANMQVDESDDEGESFEDPHSEAGKKIVKKERKKHCCKFCMKLVGNFKRHLIKIHNQEVEVTNYQKITLKSERMAYMLKIMAQGDAIYNKNHPERPIVRRISKKIERETCPNCKMLISDRHIVDHLRKCSPESKYLSGPAIRAKINRDKFLIHQDLNEDMQMNILPFMKNGKIKQIIVTDTALILYGNRMCNRLKGEKQEKTIRNHLRILGRVTEKAIELSRGAISCAEDIFNPKLYNIFVNAIYQICGYGEATGMEMVKPTTPHQYGPKMKDLSDTILTELLKEVNEEDEEETHLKNKIEKIKTWQMIYDRDFDKQIASLGRKQAERRTYERRQLAPSMEDVQKLLKHIEDRLTSSVMNLKERFTIEAFKTLSKCLLLKLWIFNRKRVGEIDDILLSNWENKKDIDESSDQFKALDKTEQRYASSFKRVIVMSKLRRPAALLVAKKDLERFDMMLLHREQALIPKGNSFLFAIGERHIEGTTTMHEFAKECGATNYELLTGTRLRKQLAASLRYLNLTDEDLRLVAESMGHTEKTHLTKYRVHDPALHAGRMGKILMAIDDGTINQYSGKTVDEIDDTVVETSDVEPDTGDQSLPSTTKGYDFLPIQPESPQSEDAKIIKRKLFPTSSEEESVGEERERGNTPGRRRAYKKRKPHKNTKLSESLKQALKNEFEFELKEKKCPTTARVLKAMEALEETFPEIIANSPRKLKVLICNWSRPK